MRVARPKRETLPTPERRAHVDDGAKRLPKPAGATRRTQAERAAISREKVIGAAVDCLARLGYAATTTNLIAATAGVSIGRLQHHFATKVDVMAAVIDHIQDANSRLLSTGSPDAASPRDRVEQFTRQLLAVFQQDTAAAAIEIRFAMKGDADLATALSPRFERYDSSGFDELENLLIAAGIAAAGARTWSKTIVAAIRGFAVERVGFYRATTTADGRDSLRLLILAIFGAADG